MGLEVVHHHDLSVLKGGHQEVLHIGLEGCPIGGSLDTHSRSDPFSAEGGNECDVFVPVPRSLSVCPLSFGRPSIQRCKRDVSAALVHEDELRAELERNGLEVGRLEREGRTVWASFDWVMQVDLETALEQQKRLTELVDKRQLVVKTAALEETLEEWPATVLRRALSSHSAIILAFKDGLSLSRATPMPPS